MTIKLPKKNLEQAFFSLAEKAENSIFIFSKYGYEYVNPAFENLVGFSASEICRPDFDPFHLIHPEDRRVVHASTKVESTDAAVPRIYKYRIISRDGEIKPVEATISALSGDDERMMGFLREITAHQNIERSLQRSEEDYRYLIERANDGIAIVQDSILKYINPKAAEIAGFTPDELINTPFDRYLATDDVPILEDPGAQRKKTAKGGSNILEGSIKHKQGVNIRAEINSGEITYQGKPANLVILRDISDRRRTEEELSQTLEKLRKAMGATIQAMSLTIETRDPYTAGHQKRVSDLARAIATEMKFPREDIDAIRMAASIHDLGKISIPAEILSKPGKISEFEFRLIQNHPKIGFEILRTIEFPWPIADIVLQHHERMNGSGYPNGLMGDKILPIARILAVADVVEAMVSHRPYRSALTLGEAIHEISKNRSVLYDPEAVDACKRLFIEGRFVFKP